MTARRLLAPACALLLLLVAPTIAVAAGPRPLALRPVSGPTQAIIGIADQKASVFADERFGRLGLQHARRTVPWDVLRHPDQRERLDAWVRGAVEQGIEPLITFARSSDRRLRRPPTVRRFALSFLEFRARYPEVRTYSTWNEANHCGEGVCRRIDLVVRYWRAIQRNCRGCTVLAVDLLDQPNMVRWARAFTRRAGTRPTHWGLHNYVGANRFDSRRTRELLRAVPGEVWFTETGGLVARRNRSNIRLPQGRAHAARATRYIFERMARIDRRVTRIYLYHWSSESRTDTWDSAFIGSDGIARPSLRVLERLLSGRAGSA